MTEKGILVNQILSLSNLTCLSKYVMIHLYKTKLMKKIIIACLLFVAYASSVNAQQDKKSETLDEKKQESGCFSGPNLPEQDPNVTTVTSSDGRTINITISGNVYAPITILFDRGNAMVTTNQKQDLPAKK